MMIHTDTVHALTSLPATDLNFVSCLKSATNLQIELYLRLCGIVMEKIRAGLQCVIGN